MKPLIKVMLVLSLIFASTFILGRVLGILTVDNVKSWLEAAQNVDPIWVVTAVIALLFLDLFVAVPTLTITILAGFFLGFHCGLCWHGKCSIFWICDQRPLGRKSDLVFGQGCH